MPYPSEYAHRLGHVPTVNNSAVQEAFSRWQVVQARPDDGAGIRDLCVPVSALTSPTPVVGVRFAITVDGSDTEVEATREYPTVKVGYIRVAGSFVELEKLASAGVGPFVDSQEIRRAHRESAFDAALPGSGLAKPGCSGVDTWRQELDHFLGTTRFDLDSASTLADALLTMHGVPGHPADCVSLRTCPNCEQRFTTNQGPKVTEAGGICPCCNGKLYLADVLRTHEEYMPEGSNQTALTRVMLVAERLMTLSYLEYFYTNVVRPEDILRQTIFITDGPLALFGTVAPLKRRLSAYHEAMFEWAASKGIVAPLIVGVEKTGRFVEHADLIRDLIPNGNVMRLTTDYINRITGRPVTNQYGTDEFYGRRFIYRTTSGDPLVITVPPRPGIMPYEGPGADDFDSYPTLRIICEVLDAVRTRLYANAIIPLALAHSAASLPLGVGQSVLRAMAQKGVGLPMNTQIQSRPPFHY